ncbi:EcoAI/FtnUII family type I restriction enzme subunit R [Arthrobacter sp. D2-10]
MKNEAETRAEFIDPAIRMAGWGVVEDSQVRREVIAPGRIQGGGGTAEPTIADYVLRYRGRKLAVIEAKRWDLPVTEGVAQAKVYASKLCARFAYSTNGQKIYEIDMETGREGLVQGIPTPQELWERLFPSANEWRNRFAALPGNASGGVQTPRYYQELAVERVLDSIAMDRKRILLTLATGTGKTFIAFQVAWKLYHSRWNVNGNENRRPRILFLADRNILADQAFNAFSQFPEDAMVRITPKDIVKRGRVPTNGSVFFTIFQTFMAEGGERPNFGAYPSDFFDFIIVDECHRGGASDESSWRAILDHFASAVQLGLTATPLRKLNGDTYRYFGDPVYSYSLKEGIQDGFLTPYRIRRYQSTIDEYVYVPGDMVIEGEVTLGRTYDESDFNRLIFIREREEYRVRLFMSEIDQNQKTIVFCASQEHALIIRDLVNQIKSSSDPDYCHRVTADDGLIGEIYLRQFQDNERTVPTILTTSKKLSTGVDARNVRNIVLLRPVTDMIEFKQIMGRGTRLYRGKDFFTVYDFVNAHQLFRDPTWDGEPLPTSDEMSGRAPQRRTPMDGEREDCEESSERSRKVEIKLRDGKARSFKHLTSTMFVGPDGLPISIEEFIARLFETLKLPGLLIDEKTLRAAWGDPDTRQALRERLSRAGFSSQDLTSMQSAIGAEDCDLLDVLEFIAFAIPLRTREERVNESQLSRIDTMNAAQSDFVDFLVSSYIRSGVDELSLQKLGPLLELKYQTITDGVRVLGGVEQIRRLFIDFQKGLYDPPEVA